MIAIRLMGGMGNQMFQYALLRKLAHAKNTQPVIDMVFFDNIADVDTPREYDLGCFNIIENVLPPSKRPFENPEPEYLGRRGKIRLIKHRLEGRAWRIYREPDHSFDPNVLNCGDRSYLVGYWQTEKYFSDIRPLLLQDYTFKPQPSVRTSKILKQIKNSPSISLHVRRGDYVKNKNANKFHGTKGFPYYERALKEITSLQPDNYRVFVFSDDIDWCKRNIKFDLETIYLQRNDNDYEDMRLMMNCTHNIIANSSFSWWAAWLNQNESKIVVGPKKWFNDSSINTSDILPESWIKI